MCVHVILIVMVLADMVDGWRMASGAADNTVRVWDYQRRMCLQTLQQHTNTGIH
jgi:WD40 repeat protein